MLLAPDQEPEAMHVTGDEAVLFILQPNNDDDPPETDSGDALIVTMGATELKLLTGLAAEWLSGLTGALSGRNMPTRIIFSNTKKVPIVEIATTFFRFMTLQTPRCVCADFLSPECEIAHALFSSS